VNVQLIRAGTDEHLWAESYNRKLDDIFAVEGEVAGAIADQLQAKLTGSEKQELAAKPTSKPEAYDAYLRGLGMYRKNDDPGLTSAENFLKQAVQLDPDFALAWALLSRVHAIRFFNGDEVTEARRAAARQAVDQAVRLQPDLAEVQLAQGYYQYWVERDYDAAGHRFADLSAKWPNNAEILEALGLILRRQGHWEEGGAYLDRAVALDPLSLSPRLNAIDVKIFTRDLPGAMKRVNEALDIWPDNAAFLADKALIHLVLGQFDQAESVVASLHPQPTDFAAILAIRNVAQARRSYSSAITQVKALLETNQAKSPNDFNSGFLHFTLADLQRLAGDTAEAAKNYTQARDEALRLLKDQPDNSALYDVLAFSQAGLGDREAAVKSMDKAASLVPLAKDALQGVIWETDRALLEARLGDRDRAIPDLEHLLKIPGYLNPEILRYSPDFDPIRDDPRFQKLCQEPGK
jgi:tetratricopeptide (TPR) repeat protein